MINKASYTKNWLESFRKSSLFRKSDPALIEKMIMALTLLEQLAIHNLDFIFKGGTALILLLDNANRFSVDIDISTNEEKEKLEAILGKIIPASIFKELKPDSRNKKGSLDKAHYKFYYDSEISITSKNRMANYVLLDVVFEKSVYPELKPLQIKTKWIKTEEPYLQINAPSINSILGDKLTAFAPNTTGIEYGKGKEIEIIKQLYDVSELIDSISNIKMVYNSFLETAQKEISYRLLDIKQTQVLDDIFETALLIVRRDKNRSADKLKYVEIQRGINNFQNFLISKSFRITFIFFIIPIPSHC